MHVCIVPVNAQLHYSIVHSLDMTLAEFLQALIDRAGENPNSLASKAKATQSTIQRILKGDTMEPRKSTVEKIARFFNVRVEAFFSDQVRAQEAVRLGLAENPDGQPLAPAEPSVEYVGPAPTRRLVAVVGQARLGENGWYDVVQEVGCDGFVEAVSNDPDAYALRVLGDSMFPAIRNGWYVVVEPNHAINPSDFVAVALTDGRKMVKEFLYRTADEVGLQSVNGNKRLTVPLAEIATMHPIGSLVSPGKYRSAT